MFKYVQDPNVVIDQRGATVTEDHYKSKSYYTEGGNSDPARQMLNIYLWILALFFLDENI